MMSNPISGERKPGQPLRCPYCQAGLVIELVYTGGGYSEHRDVDGVECENWRCDAAWKPNGEPLRGPLVEPPILGTAGSGDGAGEATTE